MIRYPADLTKLEREIYSSSTEKAYGWSAAFLTESIRKEGNSYEISWTFEDKLKVINGIVTHNHPRPSFPAPSLQDLLFMKSCNLQELRVVSKDYFAWRKISHRTCTRIGFLFPYYDPLHYRLTVKKALTAHKVPFTEDTYGVHPKEILKYSIDAMDEAMVELGKDWAFEYKAWSD